MARLLTGGFEWNDVNAGGEPLVSASVIISQAVVRSGSYAAKCDSGAGNLGSFATSSAFAPVASTSYFARCYFCPVALPSTTAQIFKGIASLSARLTTTGTFQLWDAGAGTQIGSDSSESVVADGATWFRLELGYVLNASSQITDATLRLDGTTILTASGLTRTTGASFVIGWLTAPGANTVMYVDDYAMNDSTGASQTSWPGDGKIVLLRPTADSAVGTGWTLGNTTATGGNAWQREDNIPPDSATDLTTTADATQIRNATSNANVNYDATMKTYTAAGVTGTVNVVVPIIATGAPVVTSAKAGTVGVASNPAITNVALGAGGTAGAFWSGVAMGTYPTGNKWSFGTTTYAPTVTLGTAPVMRVTQVTASTRIAIVTEMGIYVDYTPVSGTTYAKAGHGVESA